LILQYFQTLGRSQSTNIVRFGTTDLNSALIQVQSLIQDRQRASFKEGADEAVLAPKFNFLQICFQISVQSIRGLTQQRQTSKSCYQELSICMIKLLCAVLLLGSANKYLRITTRRGYQQFDARPRIAGKAQ
jgi:hypothetical protein